MVSEVSLAQSAHETIPEYRLRGAGLFETYSAEILGNYQAGGLWITSSITIIAPMSKLPIWPPARAPYAIRAVSGVGTLTFARSSKRTVYSHGLLGTPCAGSA